VAGTALAERHLVSLPGRSVTPVTGRARIEELIRRHLDPSAVHGLAPAIASLEAVEEDVIVLSPAFADRPGLLVLTPYDLRFVAADGTDEARAPLERLASAEVTTTEGRTVMVVVAIDGRRTLFLVGDDDWTGRLARLVTLALDDPGAARIVADGWGPPLTTTTPTGGPSSSSRAARDRLQELDALLRDGLLTPAEHAAQRATVISQI
jgi:hypothetical protein